MKSKRPSKLAVALLASAFPCSRRTPKAKAPLKAGRGSKMEDRGWKLPGYLQLHARLLNQCFYQNFHRPGSRSKLRLDSRPGGDG